MTESNIYILIWLVIGYLSVRFINRTIEPIPMVMCILLTLMGPVPIILFITMADREEYPILDKITKFIFGGKSND